MDCVSPGEDILFVCLFICVSVCLYAVACKLVMLLCQQVETVVKKHKAELLEKRYKANIGALLSESARLDQFSHTRLHILNSLGSCMLYRSQNQLTSNEAGHAKKHHYWLMCFEGDIDVVDIP